MLSISFYDGIAYHRQDFLSRDSDFFGNGVVTTAEFPATFPATPNMTFSLGQGRAWVDGYRINNDNTPVVLTVFPGSSNPRIDIVQLGHDDVNGTYSLVVKQGVPAASNPIEPGADAGYIKLWAIAVAAGATSITAANFTDRRTLVPLNVSGSQISFAGAAGANQANIFTGGNQTLGAQNAATASNTDYPSWEIGFSRSHWSGSAAVNYTSFLQVDTAGKLIFINEDAAPVFTVDQTGLANFAGGVTIPAGKPFTNNGSFVGTAILPVSMGGTGNATQTFADLTTAQTIAGAKTFSSPITLPGDPTSVLHAGTKQYIDAGVASAKTYAP